ncbi:minor tail protein [Arthrobacter phage Decurro]|uniref:Minor tail protein n=26 Tax=Decurrovirus decurro TaxID=1982105 RepID=A0A0U4IWN3_9CAUD|nr:minor tail protein [Arthrobacter phage Decurro]ALF00767.1 minor tail protein [Arthrobacter phage Jessica]ALF00855.1 minor tail protein [Arthrobacter phage Sandman]ALJ97695.1 minor tail protein [Arthrobacter phage TymAbreu]ALY09638.1 minor tail protein [Arthrobacter phage Maggie]ALY09741.1 minor tail protein [Arthrobacter phage Moloch]ALY09767.1 minor tail protein [Arthrobacter phage Muttlie]ALY10441.1 minor tail protein [Arthrobacter phage Stratus]ALY10909.1 minor tail protein [Arthrobac
MGTKLYAVVGGAKLRSTLRKAGADMKELSAVNRDVANIVLPVARATAPTTSGKLGSTVRAGATQKSAIIRVGSAKAPYGPVVHYWHKGNYTPNPWVSLAAQKTEPTWLARYHAGIERIINQVTGA